MSSRNRRVESSPEARAQGRAAMAALRAWWPAGAFAAQLAPPAERHAMATVAAVLRQLHEILTSVDDHESGGCATHENEPKLALPVMDQSAQGCCGESMEQRRAVCDAVLDHLFAGEPTGRPDLDGFARVTERYDLPRETFDAFLIGAAAHSQTRRFATWKALRHSLDQTGGSVARIVLRVLESQKTGTEMVIEDQARAVGVAITLIEELSRTAAAWRAGRLALPLEDLVKAGLSERALGELVSSENHDARLSALIEVQVGRGRALLAGGEKLLRGIENEKTRRAAVSLIASYESDLDAIATMGSAALWRGVKPSIWTRLRSVWRGMRLVARG